MSELLREAVPVLALVALLASAYRHPSPAVEALVAVLASAAALSVGLLPLDRAGRAVADLAPVVAFLATILLVAEVCARAGLFAAAGRLLRPRGGRAGGARLFTVAFALAAVVTVVLSLDATVVLLTPVVVGAAVAAGASSRPAAFACVRMANSASLLLPVSNLTNLLALPALGLTFAGFARAMALPLVAVLLVEYVVLRALLRREIVEQGVVSRLEPGGPFETAPERLLRTSPHTSTHEEAGGPRTSTDDGSDAPVVPAVVVALMLAGFVVTSPLEVQPWVVSTVAAVVLTAWAGRRGLIGVRRTVAALSPSFVLFVLALGVVVATLGEGFLGEAVTDVVRRVVPVDGGGRAVSFVALLAVAVVATVLANLVTNLSATLLLVPVVAPLGPAAVLAALVGLNVGSGLTLTGSLANLLWRRSLAPDLPGQPGHRPGLAAFHRVSLVVTPLSVVAAVAALAWTT